MADEGYEFLIDSRRLPRFPPVQVASVRGFSGDIVGEFSPHKERTLKREYLCKIWVLDGNVGGGGGSGGGFSENERRAEITAAGRQGDTTTSLAEFSEQELLLGESKVKMLELFMMCCAILILLLQSAYFSERVPPPNQVPNYIISTRWVLTLRRDVEGKKTVKSLSNSRTGCRAFEIAFRSEDGVVGAEGMLPLLMRAQVAAVHKFKPNRWPKICPGSGVGCTLTFP